MIGFINNRIKERRVDMQFIDIAIKIIAILIGLFGLLFTICNWVLLYYRIVYKGTSSFAPIIGGVCVTIAFLLYKPFRKFWWLGLLLDISIDEIFTG